MSNINILVTGANGFVGSALLDGLIKEGKCNKIVAMHRSELTSKIKQRFGDTVHWVKADITISELNTIVTNIDTVFHLAAYSTTAESETERHLLEQINVRGTQRLVDACKEAGVRHFIYVSSIAACEAGPKVLIDERNGFPVSSYGKSKKCAEDYILKMSGNGFETTVLRPTALFGEDHLGSIYELIKTINKGRFCIFGQGRNSTNFYYILDFVNVLLSIKNDIRSYQQIFIAADSSHQLRDLALYIVEALGSKRRIPRIPSSLGYAIATGCDIVTKLSGRTTPLSRSRYHAMTRDVVYSNLKLSDMLNIRPTYGIVKGINNTIEWYRKKGLI
ncbi:MAG: NAD(P)-dependent oxidoreductase [Legionella sp.]|nr:MAG: NAD(P)-dependent oxidoreductase [Legionella sp.]